MLIKRNNVVRQINDFCEVLKGIEKLNGTNVYITALGDRKIFAKFKSLHCYIVNDKTEKCLLMVEDIKNEEDCQEIWLNPKNIDTIEVLEWDETNELEGFHVVVKMKTGNEMHFEKCVA